MTPTTSPTDTVTGLEHYPDLPGNRAAVLAALGRVGTPVFLCQPEIVASRYAELDRALRARWRRSAIAYSFKTNYLVARSGILPPLGAWAEVVSGHEYGLARDLGYEGGAIVFNGPSKGEADLRRAFDEGALVNVNDDAELDTVLALAAGRSAPVRVGIRVSCTLPRLGPSRFGFSMDDDEAAGAVRRIDGASGVSLAGLHIHLYGDTDDPGQYREAATRLGAFARDHVPRYREALRFVDVGGGFPAHTPKPRSRETWDPRPIAAYVDAVADALEPFFPDGPARPTLIVEPGRYLTADAIVLVSRVTHARERDGRRVLTCDGSISMMPLTHYAPQILRAYTPELRERPGPDTDTVIHGSTCRENDLLYAGPFPPAERGDFLVHYAAGAYNSSLGPDFIFPSPSMELL